MIQDAQGNPIHRGNIIRVIVTNLPGVMGQLVAALFEKDPTFYLVEQIQDETQLLGRDRESADVLVTSAATVYPPPAVLNLLFVKFPHLRVVVVSKSGEQAVIYWLGVRHKHLSGITEEQLFSAIREAAALSNGA